MESNKFLVYESELKDRRTYVVVGEGRVVYALIWHVRSHKCGYLNIDKTEWFDFLQQQGEQFAEENRITFQSIPSKTMTVHRKIQRKIPAPVYNYWIGTDSYGMRDSGNVPDSAILEHLIKVMNRIEREKNDGAEDREAGPDTATTVLRD